MDNSNNHYNHRFWLVGKQGWLIQGDGIGFIIGIGGWIDDNAVYVTHSTKYGLEQGVIAS